MATKECQNGYRWCPVSKKCIPDDAHDEKGKGRRQGKGQGKGPIGQPGGMEMESNILEKRNPPVEMKNRLMDASKKCAQHKDRAARQKCMTQHMRSKATQESAMEMVDEILIGSYSKIKIMESVDTILDEIENKLDAAPEDDVDQLQKDIVDELSKDSSDRGEEEANEYVENTVEENMKQAVQLLVTEEDYRTYFKSMLKKYNINSPSDLDDAKKKDFFNAVDKGWKGKKESD